MMQQPSDLFVEYIHRYPTSGPAMEWRRWGANLMDASGSFTKYLYVGNALMAARTANATDSVLLRLLLFPRS